MEIVKILLGSVALVVFAYGIYALLNRLVSQVTVKGD